VWIFSFVEGIENTIDLPQLGIHFSMQEIYENVAIAEHP
jgi:hypothetical protein